MSMEPAVDAKSNLAARRAALKQDVANFLLSSQEGLTPEFLCNSLEGLVGEPNFYISAGYPSFRSFLHFGCHDIIEVRSFSNDLTPYVFIRHDTLNEESRHIRRMVLEQKPNLKAGPIVPTIENTIPVGVDMLLVPEHVKNTMMRQLPLPFQARPQGPRYPFMGYASTPPFSPMMTVMPQGYGPPPPQQGSPYFQQMGYGYGYGYGVPPYQPQPQPRSPRAQFVRAPEFGSQQPHKNNAGVNQTVPSIFTQEVAKRLGQDQGSDASNQAEVPNPSAQTVDLENQNESLQPPPYKEFAESELSDPAPTQEPQIFTSMMMHSEEKQELTEDLVPVQEVENTKENEKPLDPNADIMTAMTMMKSPIKQLEFTVDHDDSMESDLDLDGLDLSDDEEVIVPQKEKLVEEKEDLAGELKEIPHMKWDKEMTLMLTTYISWSDFTLRAPEIDSILKLEKEMNEFYKTSGTCIPEEQLEVGGIYAVELTGIDVGWKRVQVKKIQVELQRIHVLLLDHGRTTLFRFKSNVRELTNRFRLEPRGSIECCLPIFKHVHKKPAREMDEMMKLNLDQLFFVEPEPEGFSDGILKVSFIQNMRYR